MTFAAEKFVTARKQHKCGECFRVIQPGEGYFRGAGNWEGDFWHLKWCLQCDRFRDIVLYVDDEFWQECYGGLSTWVSERMYVEIDSSFSWTFRLHVNRLQSLFRQKWAGLARDRARASSNADRENGATQKAGDRRMIRVVARRSRQSRWCDAGFAHARRIEPGDWYGRVSVAPKDEIMGAADGKWYSYPICLPCLLEGVEGRIAYFSRDKQGRKLVDDIVSRRAARAA